jgi:hypothetical protein
MAAAEAYPRIGKFAPIKHRRYAHATHDERRPARKLHFAVGAVRAGHYFRLTVPTPVILCVSLGEPV